jgi:DNA-directed RNA polymerase subunit RPC12/RpoP
MQTYEPSVSVRCSDCGRAYYDDEYRGEACRECGALL